ncbi:MAG TPA: aminomethyl-transferring glycine dehydrogenase subunit GcvPA, partial [Spirochaetia bacterium]|nr:aminomethyl-transferring glycine dehydrogenase subunit GcvPA [Spirochaetia bacterium]
SYDHIIPSTVRHVLAKPEFTTAYTPYQAEISQGILQAIFEFQTMMCLLTGLDVSNASLYDGASAAVEGCAIALQSNRKGDTILYSETLHPNVKRVLLTNFGDRGISLKEIPSAEGVTSLTKLKSFMTDSVAAVIVQSPNFFGYLEDYTGFAEVVHNGNALFIISANPMSLPLLRTPAEWGADIAVGDTQVFGFPANYGGPSAGYITAREALLRKMPGRIVGQTVDRDGRRAFVLTLQAREQHIKRERATSNICTNQALVALGNAVYLATLGEEGLKTVCRMNAQKAEYLHSTLRAELPIGDESGHPFFNEFTLRLPKPSTDVIAVMAHKGFLAGFDPAAVAAQTLNAEARTKDGQNLTIAVTEKRTRKEMDAYVEALKEVLK